jgi:hypothetical protein
MGHTQHPHTAAKSSKPSGPSKQPNARRAQSKTILVSTGGGRGVGVGVGGGGHNCSGQGGQTNDSVFSE